MKTFSRTPLLVLAALYLLSSPAFAETIVVPKEAELVVDGKRIAVEETLFLVNRAIVDGANRDASLAKKIAASLLECEREKRLALEKKHTPRWVTAAKWAGVGLVVASSFAAGVALAQ